MTMARPVTNTQLDNDGLQADVMRFMAIIAFCLIAILALVKNLDPQTSTELAEAVPDAPPPLPPSSRLQAPRQNIAAPAPELPLPVTIAPTPTDEVRMPPVHQRPKAPVSDPVIAVTPAAPPAEPLALRFASDRVFLGLIATGAIQLYATTGRDYRSMTPDFTTVPGRPSGELYELMENSIPKKVTAIFEKDIGKGVYLVTLSPATRDELNLLINRIDAETTGGTIVIHRDGHVSHEI